MSSQRTTFLTWLDTQPEHWRTHLQTDAVLAMAGELVRSARRLSMGLEDATTADDAAPRTRSKLPRGWRTDRVSRAAILDVLDRLDDAASAVALWLRWEWFAGLDPWEEFGVEWGPSMSLRPAMHDGEAVMLSDTTFETRVHRRTPEQIAIDRAIGDTDA